MSAGRQAKTEKAYRQIIDTFRRQGSSGLTAADVSAKTGLGLETVKELVPMAADEYAGRLQVTESGEILYSFPKGFISKYRGFSVTVKKAARGTGKFFKLAGTAFFKVWIMVMLVGYFALFMLLAIASLVISVGASSSRSGSRSSRGGGMGLTSSIFNMIIRIWFYSELTKRPGIGYAQLRKAGPKQKMLHHAIFSFVFGDGDPNSDWPGRERKGVIAYIQANQGVISLAEFMALTGKPPLEAERDITSYCVEFGGSPEATEAGTVVYRFDQLLMRKDRRNRSFAGLSAPLKRLWNFSSNTKKSNAWFAVINGVNLVFGSYFLFNALGTGAILTQAHLEASSYLYGITYYLLAHIMSAPLPFITIGLGIVPLAFSVFFWLIPGLRYFNANKNNEKIKLENLRKNAYSAILDNPLNVTEENIKAQAAECRPANLAMNRDRLIKELGSYSSPEVSLDEKGRTQYAFRELQREKEALEKYRAAVDPEASELGKTVFDSGD